MVSKFSAPDDGQSNGSYAGGKRSADPMNQYPSAEKRPHMDKNPAQAAQEAAARLNQKLLGTGNPQNQQNSPVRQITTETTIPDHYVGLGSSANT